MWHFIKSKKRWNIKALDRSRRRTIAWVIGNRDASIFRRLYNKSEHLKGCIFYTDDWEAFKNFKKVLPEERHVAGKRGTVAIKRNNINTRHHIGGMSRKTKIVSKKKEMVHASMKLWHALTDPNIFA